MMTDINEWARRWRISPNALADLRHVIGVPSLPSDMTNSGDFRTEAGVQQRTRIYAAESGKILWRNNVGACLDDKGNFIRYGLANESKAMNEQVKSSDLIGITPVTVEMRHVGKTFGVFTSIEVKEPTWHFTGTPREKAQDQWHVIVKSYGGVSGFLTDPQQLESLCVK